VARRVVCVDEEALRELLKIAEKLKPVLVAEITELTAQATTPATTTTTPTTTAERLVTLKEMILSVVKPGEKYTASKVAKLIREKYGVEVNTLSIGAVMRKLFKHGVLSRIARGVYEKQAKKRIRWGQSKQLVLSVMERDKAYTPTQIKRMLRDRGIEIPDGTVYGTLHRLVKEGKLEKTKHGSYRLA
jgi:DNA-binding PadR family transcriptional regulator